MADPYDHDDLVDEADRYLRETLGCGVSFPEFHAPTGNSEVPDAIAWKGLKTVLIECKTSRNDFHADKDKLVRKNPEQGMGLFRLYMAPKGVIEKDDLPPKWGLIEVDKYEGEMRSIRKAGPSGDVYNWTSQIQWMHNRNIKAERLMLYSALRRFQIRNLIHRVT